MGPRGACPYRCRGPRLPYRAVCRKGHGTARKSGSTQHRREQHPFSLFLSRRADRIRETIYSLVPAWRDSSEDFIANGKFTARGKFAQGGGWLSNMQYDKCNMRDLFFQADGVGVI